MGLFHRFWSGKIAASRRQKPRKCRFAGSIRPERSARCADTVPFLTLPFAWKLAVCRGLSGHVAGIGFRCRRAEPLSCLVEPVLCYRRSREKIHNRPIGERRVKHAGAGALDALGELPKSLRARSTLVEKRPGIFYVRGRAFLHFHEDRAGLFADLREGGDWQRLPVNDRGDHARLLAAVDQSLESASSAPTIRSTVPATP